MSPSHQHPPFQPFLFSTTPLPIPVVAHSWQVSYSERLKAGLLFVNSGGGERFYKFLQIGSRIGIGQVKLYKWIQDIREIWVLDRDSFRFQGSEPSIGHFQNRLSGSYIVASGISSPGVNKLLYVRLDNSSLNGVWFRSAIQCTATVAQRVRLMFVAARLERRPFWLLRC